MQEVDEAVETISFLMSSTTAVVAGAVAVSQIAGASGSKFIAFVGFAEIIGFLPMLNLDLSTNLKTFF